MTTKPKSHRGWTAFSHNILWKKSRDKEPSVSFLAFAGGWTVGCGWDRFEKTGQYQDRVRKSVECGRLMHFNLVSHAQYGCQCQHKLLGIPSCAKAHSMSRYNLGKVWTRRSPRSWGNPDYVWRSGQAEVILTHFILPPTPSISRHGLHSQIWHHLLL